MGKCLGFQPLYIGDDRTNFASLKYHIKAKPNTYLTPGSYFILKCRIFARVYFKLNSNENLAAILGSCAIQDCNPRYTVVYNSLDHTIIWQRPLLEGSGNRHQMRFLYCASISLHWMINNVFMSLNGD